MVQKGLATEDASSSPSVTFCSCHLTSLMVSGSDGRQWKITFSSCSWDERAMKHSTCMSEYTWLIVKGVRLEKREDEDSFKKIKKKSRTNFCFKLLKGIGWHSAAMMIVTTRKKVLERWWWWWRQRTPKWWMKKFDQLMMQKDNDDSQAIEMKEGGVDESSRCRLNQEKETTAFGCIFGAWREQEEPECDLRQHLMNQNGKDFFCCTTWGDEEEDDDAVSSSSRSNSGKKRGHKTWQNGTSCLRLSCMCVLHESEFSPSLSLSSKSRAGWWRLPILHCSRKKRTLGMMMTEWMNRQREHWTVFYTWIFNFFSLSSFGFSLSLSPWSPWSPSPCLPCLYLFPLTIIRVDSFAMIKRESKTKNPGPSKLLSPSLSSTL